MPKLELKGKMNTATVFTHNIEESAVGQVIKMLNEPITKGTKVAIMPDVYAGKGSTVGTTIMLPNDRSKWKVCPNVVGVDIGCSMRAIKVKIDKLDLEELDKVVNTYIPAGFNVHNKAIANVRDVQKMISNLSFRVNQKKTSHIVKSCGTLGGGNHYIELGTTPTGEYWLTVHSGSRGLGVLVADYHQKEAQKYIADIPSNVSNAIFQYLTENNRQKDIGNELAKYKSSKIVPEYLNIYFPEKVNDMSLAYLEGEKLENYLNDIAIAQEYSKLSRKLMLTEIAKRMGWEILDEFESMHNYIDLENGIIRKGATSAQQGERLIIPLNMRDGSIFATGKGNKDWNFSAPHGAGRVLSRSKAKELISMEDYKDSMEGIYTTSVTQSTLSESPFAYKESEEIIENIKDTVEIDYIVKPIYNFKAH